ncbi:MAG TPA: 50S ribosomal protein L20 [Kofleriaceae bacterium]|jgi:large subunit ribosomal protein L20|nr:50S ribosomal protein L20 [Kofleriaceae bacterium]
MPRAKRGFKARRRRNRVLKAAKGFRGKRSSCHAIANEAVQHAWMHMYRSRKVRKRDFRALWIQRINAAARSLGHSYSKLMGKLGASGVALNRKMLAEIAISDPVAFQKIASA